MCFNYLQKIKMKWVNVKECRLIDQWLHSSIASATWGDIIKSYKDMTTIFKVREELSKSELYKTVGGDIEKKAEEIVETKCKPEWNRISEEMKPLGELRNKLAKEKAEWNWDNEKEAQLNGLDKEMSDLSAEYQNVTDEANAELNEYKEKRINEEQGAAFLLDDAEYDLVGWYCWF